MTLSETNIRIFHRCKQLMRRNHWKISFTLKKLFSKMKAKVTCMKFWVRQMTPQLDIFWRWISIIPSICTIYTQISHWHQPKKKSVFSGSGNIRGTRLNSWEQNGSLRKIRNWFKHFATKPIKHCIILLRNYTVNCDEVTKKSQSVTIRPIKTA